MNGLITKEETDDNLKSLCMHAMLFILLTKSSQLKSLENTNQNY